MGYKCVICGKELNEKMCQISIFNPDNKNELIGNACMSCEGNEGLKLIKVYKVGNNDIGWCYYENYKKSIFGADLFDDLDSTIENEMEIVSV